MRSLTSKQQLLEKKKLILRLVRDNPEITRSEIKRLTGLSMEMVLKYIAELIEAGLIYNSGTSTGRVGRQATYLKIKGDGCFFLGVTYNVAGVNAAVIDFSGEPMLYTSRKLEGDTCKEQVINEIFSCCDTLIKELGRNASRLKSISVGGSGYIDSVKGECIRYSRVKSFENVPIKALLEERYALPVFVEHIVKATAIQYRLREGNTGLNNYLYFFVGQGVGMAAVVNGCVLHGAHNGSGEVGHLFYRKNGRLCACGREGCFETELGLNAICDQVEVLQKQGRLADIKVNGLQVTPQLVVAANNGDADAIGLIKRQGQITALLLSGAVSVLDPQLIVLGGDMAQSPIYVSEIREQINNLCLSETAKSLEYQSVNYSEKQLCVCAAMIGYNEYIE